MHLRLKLHLRAKRHVGVEGDQVGRQRAAETDQIPLTCLGRKAFQLVGRQPACQRFIPDEDQNMIDESGALQGRTLNPSYAFRTQKRDVIWSLVLGQVHPVLGKCVKFHMSKAL